MKRFAILAGSIMLVAISSYSVFAWGPMRSGGGPGDCWQDSRTYDRANQVQQAKVDQLNNNVYQDIAQQRERVRAKRTELRVNPNAPTPYGENGRRGSGYGPGSCWN
ncbi:MAG: hypothetical protein HN342_13790 [Nitrospina sp.]|jgi:hypothetical protein|nr:hypothetical protein [Nitrospina sp.]